MHLGKTFFCALTALAMSLGWGLRGSIGGGPMGALIPGAMTALCLCMLLRLDRNVLWIAAAGAIGVGLGGQMTYGQTIGFIREAETFWFGFLGLTLKGAAWGLAGGVVLGMAMMSTRYARWEFLVCLALMVAATMLGWATMDYPKRIYFSNRLDKPREELLVGLYLGALAFGLLPALRGRERLTWSMGLYGLIFGGIGFGGGGLLMRLSSVVPKEYQKLPYWKGMEFTFGALLGLGFALATWRHREEILRSNQDGRELADDPICRLPAWLGFATAMAIAFGGLWFHFSVAGIWPELTPAQGMFTITGAVLLAIALGSDFLAAHIALSLTVCAFYRDFLLYAVGQRNSDAVTISPASLWAVVFLMAMPITAYVWNQLEPVRGRNARLFLLLTWIATIVCFAKLFVLEGLGLRLERALLPRIVFALELAALTWMTARFCRETESPERELLSRPAPR